MLLEWEIQANCSEAALMANGTKRVSLIQGHPGGADPGE